MAWAIRSDTKLATYIGMLDRSETGLNCNCVCPACGGILQAVNAGLPAEHFLNPATLRPFFRHHTGQQTAACLVKVAQIVALRLLMESDEIDLPAPSARQSVVGVSGTIYTQEVVGLARTARIVERSWVDEHAARIVLDDGRVVLIQLQGKASVATENFEHGVITITVDDPELSTWSPEKILQNARLDGEWLSWACHWDDVVMQDQALANARAEALSWVDLAPDGYVLPDGLTPLQRSESVLHWVIKDILGAAGQIRTPAVHQIFSREMPDGQQLQRTASMPAMTLELSNVRVEYNLHGLRPDVMCRAVDTLGRFEPIDLLIEVAVTHRVDEAKKTLIKTRGLACIEFDVRLVSVGGRVTKSALTAMVLGDPSTKRWIHHAELQRRIDSCEDELSNAYKDMEKRLLGEQIRYDQFKALSTEDALNEYLDALRDHWGGTTHLVNKPSRWTVKMLRQMLDDRGFSHLVDYECSGSGGFLRYLDIIRSAGFGSAVSTHIAERIIRVVGNGTKEERQLITLLLLAIRVYEPVMSKVESVDLQACRERVKRSIQDGESTFARPTRWDGVISVMFPEMAYVLKHKFGTAAYAESVSRDKQEDQRREEKVHRELDDTKRAVEQQRRHAESLLAEMTEAYQVASVTVSWSPMDGSIPLDSESAFRFFRGDRWRISSPAAHRDRELIESAWDARASGLQVVDWIASRNPENAVGVGSLCQLLVMSWLGIKTAPQPEGSIP